ncbi:Putative cytosolic protein [Borrelia crocidurae DOU]|uniref:Cytosolic protein n=1 Tax=Borrelia crocidurae DOU TaxID=1293575 RepID=W5SM61_9SPIR|nr:hypothetical protein [Borrelia crocidurae]AHH06201.1 Putative cytosolic protein [Borrelia crocidurae DOU]
MMNLDNYLIVCNDFKGEIGVFFDYIRNKREILKTFNLNKIIEDFLAFSENIEMDVRELIKFYSFTTSLLYLKTQVLYPVKLKDRKFVEKEIVNKLMKFSDKYVVSKKFVRKKDEVCLDISKFPFLKKNVVFLKNVDDAKNYIANINEVKNKDRTMRVSKERNDILSDRFRFNIVLDTYDAKIADKKNKIMSLLAKEDKCRFEFLLRLDDKFYFFERFCYFLIVLEYKMSNVIDLVYVNNELIVIKGRGIDEYKQQRA